MCLIKSGAVLCILSKQTLWNFVDSNCHNPLRNTPSAHQKDPSGSVIVIMMDILFSIAVIKHYAQSNI